MRKLRHVGFSYSVALETGVIPIHFESADDASTYCKNYYSNTVFQIIPIPLFTFQEIEQK